MLVTSAEHYASHQANYLSNVWNVKVALLGLVWFPATSENIVDSYANSQNQQPSGLQEF